ncbi:glycosyl hydrolase [Ramlibacter sp. G-1-2-2]|uniref:Glycosyl hydrolase n=1 Tax=Ramlibacter agri TaxID=2728837 RepID=A0A848H3L7_9BURK|nr:YCF48-related protein [Ramlibacter agri]NML44109.1 glycosyl hydrolase [Ramlibacter agri]
MRQPLALLLAAGIAAGAVAQATTAAPARDVLDTPALATKLADRALLNALAQAGKRIVAVGQRGHVLLSDDGGKTWQQAEVPVSADLVAVHFPTPDQGWAVGHDGVILHSADGGRSWKKQRDGRPDSADVPLLDVWFEDAGKGIAVGAFGSALRTADGGAHWEPLPKDAIENPKGLHLYAVRGIGSDLWMAGEQGLLLKLDRASGRFVRQAQPYEGTLFGVTGTPQVVVAFGLRGNAVRSTDGGATWQAVPTGIPSGLTAGAVDAQGRILLAGQAGQLLVSEDGASFRPIALQRPAPAAALLSLGSAVLVAGPRGVQLQQLP